MTRQTGGQNLLASVRGLGGAENQKNKTLIKKLNHIRRDVILSKREIETFHSSVFFPSNLIHSKKQSKSGLALR